MNFESFAFQIMDVREYTRSQKKTKTLTQRRFQLKNTNMKLVSVNRKEFAGLNDKRYYLTDGVTSLPYGNFLLSELRDKKKQYKEIHKVIIKV